MEKLKQLEDKSLSSADIYKIMGGLVQIILDPDFSFSYFTLKLQIVIKSLKVA
jgi:hypothetical protein